MAISGWGIFLIILVLVVIGGGGGYVFYAHWRARKQGLPPPTLASLVPFNLNRGGGGSGVGGVADWFKDKWHDLRSGRSAGGAYEGGGYGGAGGNYSEGRRGFGPLDPDEAWDARVGEEAGGYYEEQELGLQDPSRGPYGGGGYGEVGPSSGDNAKDRGRSRSRDGRSNPFGEQAEESNMSLRSISPRPDVESSHPKPPGHARVGSNLSTDESQSERRSMFREDV